MTDLNERIKARREELKLSDVEVARATEMTIDSYFDIELYPEEFVSVVPLRNARLVCKVLRFNLLELLNLPCAFCAGHHRAEDYRAPRNELLKQHRVRLGWSHEELARRLDWTKIYDDQETKADELEDWRLDTILELAEALQIPPQVLLDFRCPSCGR